MRANVPDEEFIAVGNYLLRPSASLVPATGYWQPVAVVKFARASGKTRIKSFPCLSAVFVTGEEAREYAMRYGRMLIAGKHQAIAEMSA